MSNVIFHPQELTQRILDLFGCHLQDYIRAKELMGERQTPQQEICSKSEQLWNVYSSVAVPHLAMTSEAVEVNYTRAVADLLLHILVPPPHIETNSGRFVVGELITCNVLLPFIATLSDPDWLNSLLIVMCGNSNKPNDPTATESQRTSPPLEAPPAHSEPVPPHDTTDAPQVSEAPLPRAEAEMFNGTDTATPETAAYDVTDPEEVDCPLNSAEEEESTQNFLSHYTRGRKSNPFYQESDSDLDSPFADYQQSSTDSLVTIGQGEGLYVRQVDCDTRTESYSGDLDEMCPSSLDATCPKVLVNSQPSEHQNCNSSSVRAAEGTSGVGTSGVDSLQDQERESGCLSAAPQQELLLGVEHSGPGNPAELTDVSPSQNSSQMPSFSFEPLSSPDGPVIIQNLRITGTITAKEHRGTGSHPYTLYTIKVRTRKHLLCVNLQGQGVSMSVVEICGDTTTKCDADK